MTRRPFLIRKIQDMGKAFDPVNPSNGIPDLSEAAPDLTYSYTFRQNNVVMKWAV